MRGNAPHVLLPTPPRRLRRRGGVGKGFSWGPAAPTPPLHRAFQTVSNTLLRGHEKAVGRAEPSPHACLCSGIEGHTHTRRTPLPSFPADGGIEYSNLSLHDLFAQQARELLDRSDLDEEQKQSLLVAMSCPCCGAGGMS